MTSAIRIKRRDSQSSSGAGAPNSLLQGELAFNEPEKVLYYGFGSGAQATVIAIAGEGAYFSKNVAQSPNTILAGPAATPSANPTFRSLVADDIPNILAAKITDFDTQVQTNTIDSLAAATAPIDAGSQLINNVATPLAGTDAANKAYVDAARTGLDVKESVRAATTGNITLSGTQAIDGVTLAAGERVLVKDQNTPHENGIYVVASGAWSRSDDADTSDKVTPGMFTFVEEGTSYDNTGWVLANNATVTLNTTGLSFVQFSGAGVITAGAGLTKTGNTLDVVGTSGRISVGANSIDISSGYAGQTSITTLGTITSGTWNGTAIDFASGGTGLTTAPQGSVLIANAADTLTALDGGGSNDGILSYNATTDTISWENEIDGGSF